jgi:putative endonuclease
MKLNIIDLIFRRRGPVKGSPAETFLSEADRDAHRKRLGQIGERAAVKQLRRQGYRILERNFLARGGEVDIIAEHRGTIVFVEVKTRSPRAWASPESAVTAEKKARVMRAAKQYLADYRTPSPIRYDVVAIITNDNDRVKSLKIEQHAFEAE